MKLFLSGFLMLMTVSSWAATSIDLNVAGQVSPPACDIALADVNFAFGSSIVLNATGNTELTESAAQSMTILCAAPAYVGFIGVDNRSGTSTNTAAYRYGLGVDSAGNNIGSYKINLSNPSINGGTAYVKYTLNDGSTWRTISSTTSVGDLNTYAGQNSTYAINPTNNGTAPPESITNASINLSVTPTIMPRNTLDTNNAINLDGSATIELKYF